MSKKSNDSGVSRLSRAWQKMRRGVSDFRQEIVEDAKNVAREMTDPIITNGQSRIKSAKAAFQASAVLGLKTGPYYPVVVAGSTVAAFIAGPRVSRKLGEFLAPSEKSEKDSSAPEGEEKPPEPELK